MPPLTPLPVLAIAGPTASGKSHLALRLARKFGGEIVNCDSIQMYRGFDIGAAKPTSDELAAVPHHLIDALDPDGESNAGHWARLAEESIRDISARGALPVIAGGTGFYLRALFEGLAPGPERDPELRVRLAQREARRSGFLHRLLRRLDPATAKRIHPNDVNKLTRAVEICAAAGKPASELFAAGKKALEGYRALKLVLNPERELLQEAIRRRAERMWAAGLVAEVEGLLRGGVERAAKPFESLGYKEALAFMEGRMSEAEALERITIETRQYAKRQLTWFRREAGVVWLHGFGHEEVVAEEAESRVREFLGEFTFMKVY